MVSIATNKFMAILNIRWPFKMYSNAAISKEVNNLFTTKKKNKDIKWYGADIDNVSKS